MPDQRAIDFKVTLHVHGADGLDDASRTLDLTPYVRTMQRSKAIQGQSVGAWQLGLEIHAVRDAAILWALKAYAREGDWITLDLFDSADPAHPSPMIGLTDDPTFDEDVGGDGEMTVEVGLSGRDWGRCMTDSEARLSAIFRSSVEIDNPYLNTPAVPDQAYAPDLQFTETNANNASAVGFHPSEVVEAPNIPGILTEKSWADLVKGATNVNASAHVPLETLLRLILNGQWQDPHRKTLLDKLSWQRFGRDGSIRGCPWQLQHLIPQQTVTPDNLLRQFGNLAFNELFYEYNESRTAPAIIYRRRPWDTRPGGTPWERLPRIVLDPAFYKGASLSRNGQERGTFYRALAPAAGLSGGDMLVRTEAGNELPIMDGWSIARFGLRAVEPQCQHYPPPSKPNVQQLEWHYQDLARMRRWFYNNPEYLRGTVKIEPAWPEARCGVVGVLPIPWSFMQWSGGQRISFDVDRIEAYIVGVADSMSIDGDGTIFSSTTLSVIRGQPLGGLPVPPPTTWGIRH